MPVQRERRKVGHLRGWVFQGKREKAGDQGTEPRTHWERWKGAPVCAQWVMGMEGETEGAVRMTQGAISENDQQRAVFLRTEGTAPSRGHFATVPRGLLSSSPFFPPFSIREGRGQGGYRDKRPQHFLLCVVLTIPRVHITYMSLCSLEA